MHLRESTSVHLSLFKTFTENGLSKKENEIQELKEELRLQQEQNTKNLQDMEQQFTRQVQEMEKKHSSTTRRWVLMVLMISVLAGGTINAFTSTSEFSDVLQVVNDTLNSLAVEVSHNQHLNEELKNSTMALLLMLKRFVMIKIWLRRD